MMPVSHFLLPEQPGLQHVGTHHINLLLMLLRCQHRHLWHHQLAVFGHDGRGMRVWKHLRCRIVVLGLYL